MAGLGKLLRTTAFKLAAGYLVFFSVVAFGALGYLAWNANRVLDNEAAATIESEVRALTEHYREEGMRGLADIIERRSQMPGASLYLLTNPQGEPLAGNVAGLAPGVVDRPGIRETLYRRSDEPEGEPRLALMRVFVVEGGFRVLVGRDLNERLRLREVVRRTFGWALLVVAVLGGLGALLVARRLLARVDAMSASARNFMAGDLSGRLPIAGTGDELDRLAISLNAMLDRIGELMRGMKEVSDNIAHDLKTPLTRLRNRAESALRGNLEGAAAHKALEATIEDADNLIRVFNALLTIARLEAGNATLPMGPVDIGETAREIAELYEPTAEEAQIRIELRLAEGLMVYGNRELIGQALANLLENALKYGKSDAHVSEGHSASAAILLAAAREGEFVTVTVSDHGPGIPAAERERVLERYTRLEVARTQPGFGLGLPLVAAIAKLHRGSLVLEDNRPGLKATLNLPMAKSA